MEADIPRRKKLSILQVMKLVIFCAVAFACVAPMVHLWQAGFVQGGAPQGLILVALFEAVVVPLVWVGLSLVLIRRGDWRDSLISALLLCSVVVALGNAVWLLFSYTIRAYGIPQNGVGMSSLALHALAILALASATLFLVFRLLRRFVRGPRPDQAREQAPTTYAATEFGG